MTVFLGVDGGGTKTAFALVDDAGEVLGSASTRSTYSFGDPAGTGLVAQVLTEGVAAACADAGTTADRVDWAFLGLPGYGEAPADLPALDAAPASALGHRRYSCGNDAVCGWAGSLAGADGVNVVAGTGSIAFGRHGDREARAGGWSEVFGDEGSAHWIAVRALDLFARASDGRLPAGPLTALVREHLGLTEDLELVDLVVNRWQADRTRIAALAPLVGRAAVAGDAAAAAVLESAGAELALLVTAVRTRLELPDGAPVPVSYSGGAFRSPEVLRSFQQHLGPGHELRRPELSPVLGAALHAATLAGTPLGRDAVDRLRTATAR